MLKTATHTWYLHLFVWSLATCLPLMGQVSSLDSILELTYQHTAKRGKGIQAYESQFFETCEAHVSNIPFDIWPVSGVFIPASKDTGLVYRSEALIEAKFKDRFHYFQDVLLKREAGTLPVANWHQLPAYNYNLMQERIYLDEAFDRGFASPLHAKNAALYRYELLSTKKHGKDTVHRIAFRPSKAKFPGLVGSVDILAGKGWILAASFSISADNQLELLDSISVEQIFSYEEEVYRMEQQNIEIHLNLFNFIGYYRIEMDFNEFRYRNSFAEDEFSKLVFDQKKGDFKPDTSYWRKHDGNRDVEKYFEAHLIDPELKQKFRQFGSSRLDPGPYYFYKNTYRGFTRRSGQWFIDLPPLYKGLGFNPVEGAYWRGQFRAGYSKPFDELSLRGQIRWGSADQRWKNLAELKWQGGREYPISVSLTAGTAVKQFNEAEPILPVLNTVYNLLLAQNFIHLFGKDFVKLNYNAEARSGFSVGLDLEYARRYPLFNNTSFNFVDSDSRFDLNNQPWAENIDSRGFEPHRTYDLELNLSYQFKNRHEVRYKQRFQEVFQGRKNIAMRAPLLYYDFRAGLPIFDGQTSYAFHSLGIQHRFRWANLGLSSFDISAGHFIYQAELPFIDYQHFDGVQIFFLQPTAQRSAMIKQFSTLPYYIYSTNKPYLELHYEHNFDGALLANIDFLRRYKVHSLAGFNSLHIANERAFIEVFFGFDNLFKILRVEFAGGIDNFYRLRPSLRIGFDFNYDYYKQNRRS